MRCRTMTTTAAPKPPEVCDEDYKKENPDAVDDFVEPDADECDETPETGEVQAEQDEDPASEDGPYAEEAERQANDEEYGETEAEAQEVIERDSGPVEVCASRQRPDSGTTAPAE